MNQRAFFSVFVGAFAIIFFISILYSNSVRYDTQAKAEELAILDQQVSKDWFLARNALVNFAADAVLEGVENQFSPSPLSCIVASITGGNYAAEVESYWDDSLAYMNARFGTNCDANLDVDVKNLMDGTVLSAPEVRDDIRTFGLLECTRTSANGSISIRHPFVIRKDIRVSSSAGECDVNVFDRLGHFDSGNPSYWIIYEKQDVNKAFT